jgi:hypothetical protein
MAWIAQVWILAATTLAAGIPWAECICPDGSRKVFCAGRLAKDTSCCEAAPPAKSPESKSCCPAKKQTRCVQNTEPTTPPRDEDGPKTPRPRSKVEHDSNGRVEAKGCSRVLPDTQPPTASPAKPTGRDSCASTAAALAVSLAEPLPGATAAACTVLWQPYRQPPPTDYVITLQRLTI